MKIYLILILNLFLQFQFKTDDEYEHSKKCIQVIPKHKENCNNVGIDISQENHNQKIACCLATYTTEDEGNVMKCVPIFKTLNGLHMYEEQIKAAGGSGISIDCFSQRAFISLLLINILLVLLI